jgi:putative ATPase
VSVQPEVVEWISQIADGDARAALNALELLVLACARGTLTLDFAKENLPKRWLRYDAGGDEHYNLISALHKSIRASQVDAALYYLMRMMEGGENPVFIARRLVRAASEDVGVADPQAAVQASLAMEAAQNLGAPECDVVLAQAVVYLCAAPKSQALYRAVEELRQEIGRSGASPVPVMIRDRVSGRFASQETVSEQLDKKNRFWPDAVKKRHFLRLEPIGFERELLKRLEYLNRDNG